MIKASNIKIATITDLEEIITIYNFAVLAKFETADITTINWTKRKTWFKEHTATLYPIYVYKVNNKVLGWISISPYRKGRMALKNTVEVSYYIHPNFKNKGIGSLLLGYAINACKALNYTNIIAIVIDKNVKSIMLLKKYNFKKWGKLSNVAVFDNIQCSHLYYGLALK